VRHKTFEIQTKDWLQHKDKM